MRIIRPEIHIFGWARGLANGSYTVRNKNKISRRQLYIRRGRNEILSRQCFHFQYEKILMYIGQRVFENNEIHTVTDTPPSKTKLDSQSLKFISIHQNVGK